MHYIALMIFDFHKIIIQILKMLKGERTLWREGFSNMPIANYPCSSLFLSLALQSVRERDGGMGLEGGGECGYSSGYGECTK